MEGCTGYPTLKNLLFASYHHKLFDVMVCVVYGGGVLDLGACIYVSS